MHILVSLLWNWWRVIRSIRSRVFFHLLLLSCFPSKLNCRKRLWLFGCTRPQKVTEKTLSSTIRRPTRALNLLGTTRYYYVEIGRVYIIVLSNSLASKLPREFYGGGSGFLVQQEINVLSFIVSSRYHFCNRLRYRGATSEITSVCLSGTARRRCIHYTRQSAGYWKNNYSTPRLSLSVYAVENLIFFPRYTIYRACTRFSFVNSKTFANRFSYVKLTCFRYGNVYF